MYLKITLDEMFTMRNMVVTLLQNFLTQFAKEGIAKVPYEDVRLCAKQIAAMCAPLAKVNTLPQEVPFNILEGFTRAVSPLINLGTQHNGSSARTWMKRV